MGILDLLLNPPTHLEKVEPEDNYGIGVSTVHACDAGYETALLDARGAHPVERYPDEAAARAGHPRWVEASKTIERVVQVGMGGYPDEEIVLVRIPFGVEN